MSSRGHKTHQTVSALNALTYRGTSAVSQLHRAAANALDSQVSSQLSKQYSKGVRFSEPGSSSASTSALEKTAAITSTISRKVSSGTSRVASATGNAIYKSPVATGLRHAPTGSKRRATHDVAAAGAVAAASLINTAGDAGRDLGRRAVDGAARVAGSKKGIGAERATRAAGNVAIDAYEVIRTPAKFASKTVIDGVADAAQKATIDQAAAQGWHGAQAGYTPVAALPPPPPPPPAPAPYPQIMPPPPPAVAPPPPPGYPQYAAPQYAQGSYMHAVQHERPPRPPPPEKYYKPPKGYPTAKPPGKGIRGEGKSRSAGSGTEKARKESSSHSKDSRKKSSSAHASSSSSSKRR